jgi:hypothetical protein
VLPPGSRNAGGTIARRQFPDGSWGLEPIKPSNLILYSQLGYQAAQIPALASIRDADFIQKPFLPSALVQRVKEILGNSEVCALLEDETDAAIA